MDFQPPDPADLANVHALNGAFIDCVSNRAVPEALLNSLSPPLLAALQECDAKRLDRLCHKPFLIFSLAEQDTGRWRRLFERRTSAPPDLIDALCIENNPAACLVSGALGFLWQLARRRPYAARVVSGASLAWCERLSERTLIEVLQFAVAEKDLLRLQMSGEAAFWQRMLVAGTSPEKAIRRAASLCSLQMLLTSCQSDRLQRLPAAACSMPVPPMQVAETPSVSKSGVRGYNTPPDESTPNKKSHQDLRKR